MAAFDGAEVALPELFAGVGQGGELEALRSAPGKIHAIGISCGGAGGKAVFLVVPMMLGGVIERPQDLAGMGVNCDGTAGTGFFIGAQEKDVVAPNNGRSVSGGRQWGFPFELGISPFDGDGRRADAMALRTAESGPLFFGEHRKSDEGKEVQDDVSAHVRNL